MSTKETSKKTSKEQDQKKESDTRTNEAYQRAVEASTNTMHVSANSLRFI
jgi:hypothetical protein